MSVLVRSSNAVSQPAQRTLVWAGWILGWMCFQCVLVFGYDMPHLKSGSIDGRISVAKERGHERFANHGSNLAERYAYGYRPCVLDVHSKAGPRLEQVRGCGQWNEERDRVGANFAMLARFLVASRHQLLILAACQVATTPNDHCP